MDDISTTRLTALEYAIRQAMAVREDQDDPAEARHLDEAAQCGITVHPNLTKGDLLSLVQTRIRSRQRGAA